MNLTSCYETFQGPLGQLACSTVNSLCSTWISIRQIETPEFVKNAFDELDEAYWGLSLISVIGVLASKKPITTAVGMAASVAGFYCPDSRVQVIAGTLFSSILFGNILCHSAFNSKKPSPPLPMIKLNTPSGQ